jgi:COP9 signalosome complex subunit 1
LCLEALRAAVREAKQGKDVEAYIGLCQTLSKVAPNDPLALVDTDWAEMRAKQIKSEGDRLENELKGYKNNLIKESIRVSHDARFR